MYSNHNQQKDFEEFRNTLSQIWENDIKESYSRGIISTESTLIAELYYHLKNKTQYLIWLEYKYNNKYLFDMVVTNKNEIIGIIEVKFNPNGKSYYYEHDINKLIEINNVKDLEATLLIDPNSGNWDYSRNFKINSNFLSIFIVVDNCKSIALKSNEWDQDINDLHFLHLIGSIGNNNFEFYTRNT